MSDTYDLMPTADSRQWKLSEVGAPSAGGRPAAFNSNEESGSDIFHPLRIVFKRRVWIYVCSIIGLILSAVACVVVPPTYVATSRLQLLNQSNGKLTLSDGQSNSDADGFDYFATLQTDVSVMESDTLDMQVIRELNLADSPSFRFNPLIKTAEVRREMTLPVDQAPLKRAAILNKFRSSLSVDIVPGSRLITVSYADSDPVMTAKIVNKLVSDFVEYNFQVRYDATNKATGFLSQQLVDLKAEVEKSQQHAVDLQRATGMFGVDASHDIVVARLEQLNNDVVAAQTNRVTKEALYNLARTGNPEAIAGLLGTTSSVAAPGAAASTETQSTSISSLRQKEADLNAQYADMATQYGPAYPKLIQMKGQLTAIQGTIQTELDKVVQNARNQYQLALAQEANAKKMFEEQQEVASKVNDDAASYTIAKQEADSSRTLYENLLQKMQEAGVLAGLRSSDLNILDPAGVPGRRSKPTIKVYLAGGLMAGLVLGVIAAFLAEALDRTIRSDRDVETILRLPVLALIPAIEVGSDKTVRRLVGPGGGAVISGA
jgi:succinoglycan biosynthesis transport protein ExoP